MTDVHTIQGKMGETSYLKAEDEVALTTIDPTLHKAIVAVGWEAPETHTGCPVDIDLSAFLLKLDGTVFQDTDFIFYNNLTCENGSVTHKGDVTDDNKQSGDKEMIEVDLDNILFGVERIAFSVTLHNAEDRQQTFGLIKNAYIRILNADTGAELARYDLTEDGGDFTSLVFGELVRDGLGWKFHAVGKLSKGGLFKIAHDYAVNVAPM